MLALAAKGASGGSKTRLPGNEYVRVGGSASPNDRQLRPSCVEAFQDGGGLRLHAIEVHSAGWFTEVNGGVGRRKV